MSDPIELDDKQLEELRMEPLWPRHWRMFAVALWSGFMGAVLILLALLMGWNALQDAAHSPGFGLIATCFVVAWLISVVIAFVAVSLAVEPKAKVGRKD